MSQPLIEWRSLFRGATVEAPTYTSDIVGTIDRFDERDCVFARNDLRPGSERYAEYYGSHEEFEAADAFLRDMPPFGNGAARSDVAIMDALFGSVTTVGRNPDAGNPVERQKLDPSSASERVKSVARALGADLVGIGPLRREFVYSHVGRTYYGQTWGSPIVLEHEHAISLGFAMDFGYLRRYAPGFPVILASGAAYARAAMAAVQLAAYIRGLGYSARAHHLRDYQVLSVPVAVDAGLGELGRLGILVTREFGTAVRLSTVTTDLQLVADPPVDLGIQAFCEKCSLCAMACPAGAIPRGEKMAVRGVRRWKLAAGRCYHYWRSCGSDCALCVVACPWSKPDAETTGNRPPAFAPPLDEATIARARELRATLPAWQRRLLGDGE